MSSPETIPPEPPEPPEPPSENRRRRILANGVTLAVGGVVVWLWILFFTDWVPWTLGLLGLGGVATWLSLVGRLLDEDQKGALQGILARHLLERPGWRVRAGAILVGLLALTSFGALRIRSFEEGRSRVVAVRPAAAGVAARVEHYLPALSDRRLPVWTRWWGRPFEVKVLGFPALEVEVHGLERRTLVIPDSFVRRPVVLVVPTARMSANAEQAQPPLTLVVCRGDELLGRLGGKLYRGQAVWVGCEADVEVPAAILEDWRLELVRDQQPAEILARWTPPLALDLPPRLAPGEILRAALVKPDGMVYARGRTTVREVAPGTPFVQVLRLEYWEDGGAAAPSNACGGV